jgi:hypothetical protein
MDHGIQINSQVVFKEKLFNCTKIRLGTVMAFKGDNNEIALVSLQDDPRKPRSLQASARREILVENLELSGKVFGGGRAVVSVNPTYRTIGSLINNYR